MNFDLTYRRFGEKAILIEWPKIIDENILDDILRFKNSIIRKDIKVVVDVINTYNSLCVIYDINIENINDILLELKSIYLVSNENTVVQKRLWHIPVCYDEEFAIDSNDLSSKLSLPFLEIIERHVSAIYTIYFTGFLPGFLYLGGLDSTLHINRKSIPNLNIKKGSVGIGGTQTGIYPQDSPGGWHIIGNSPVSFFDINMNKPCFSSPGDKLKFESVSAEEYLTIKKLVAEKTYKNKFDLI